jgi:hypothetical protein
MSLQAVAGPPQAPVGPPPPPPRPFFRRPGIWFFILAAISTVFVVLTWAQKYEKPGRGLTTPALPHAVGTGKGVAALAWLDPPQVEEGHHFRLWVLFENRSSSAALGLRFTAFQIAGFSPVSCWDNGPACRPNGPGQLALPGLPPRIEKDGSASVFAVLEPAGESGLYGATGVFAWWDERGARWENAVVLPAVPVSTVAERWWLISSRILQVLKDLLLPAVLACLGWYLQRRDKQIEENKEETAQAREDAERTMEQERERREKEQALLRETWSRMLPTSQRNAQRHYLPVLGAVMRLLRAGGDVRQGGPDPEKDWRVLLWSILLLHRRMRHLRKSIGGFYFRNLDGEELAAGCWSQFAGRVEKALGILELSQVVNVMTEEESFATFDARLAAKQGETDDIVTALGTMGTRLREWWNAPDHGFEENLPLLKLFSYIVKFETNRPFETWYGEPARFKRAEFTDALNRLSSDKDLKESLEKYLNSATGQQPPP